MPAVLSLRQASSRVALSALEWLWAWAWGWGSQQVPLRGTQTLFINGNKCPTLVGGGGVDMAAAVPAWGQGAYGKSLDLPLKVQ